MDDFEEQVLAQAKYNIYESEGGEWYFSAGLAGSYSSAALRVVAEELDRMNARNKALDELAKQAQDLDMGY